MRILGVCAELWPGVTTEPLPGLATLVGHEPPDDEERVVGYLRAGEEIFSAMGVVADLLGSSERVLGGDSIFTDGAWVWRGDLWFYVSRHHLRLPGEFLDSVRASGYRPPAVGHEDLVAIWEDVKPLL